MTALAFENVGKGFTLHLRGSVHLPVLERASFAVGPGECVVLAGPSGAGKSTVLKLAYGSYAADAGRILVEDEGRITDVATAPPRDVLALRRATIGYVSQFLSVIPRVPALDLVVAAARDAGRPDPEEKARAMLARLNLPERLWDLPPATFSGGEQQRVNIAIGLAGRHSVLLLDEPTASLDATNRDVVVELIAEKRKAGAAILGIFHDAETRARVATRTLDVAAFTPRLAA